MNNELIKAAELLKEHCKKNKKPGICDCIYQSQIGYCTLYALPQDYVTPKKPKRKLHLWAIARKESSAVDNFVLDSDGLTQEKYTLFPDWDTREKYIIKENVKEVEE